MAQKLSERMEAWIQAQPMCVARGWCNLVVELAQAVEVVEPEDTDATIREELGNCADGFQEAHRELAEAKAEQGRLQETVDMYADRPFWDDIHQLVIHKLRERIKDLEADAEKWQLVLGMRPWSRLARGWRGGSSTEYWVDTAAEGEPWKHQVGAWHDPAEALRSIQEVGDGCSTS